MKNVLVFPCGSEVGLEIYKSLNVSTHFTLYGGSSVSDHGQFVYENYIEGLPFIDDPQFTDKLNQIIAEYNIDFIFPAHDSAVLKLAQERELGVLKCEVVTSSVETCEVSRSKRKTYEVFNNIIPTPHMYENMQDITDKNFPIFLKPDVGQGSKGVYRADTLEDVAFYTNKDPSLLLLEYLPGKEYTIDCFTNKNGELLFSQGRERSRVSGGISVSSKVVKDERFATLARKINATLKFRGVWFFQVKENTKGEYVLMEIAPRVAGTMGLARCRGVNLPLLALFDSLNFDVSVSENSYDMVIDRALHNSYKHNLHYEHVYLDFDDLVLLNDKINPLVIAFVYQCINKSIKVHLITKHKDNIHETLERYRLTGIFDEVLRIDKTDNKHLYITEKNAIFIDDSFAERKEVQDQCKIPVFDSHMIESLTESFK